jgi:hypothetical protein
MFYFIAVGGKIVPNYKQLMHLNNVLHKSVLVRYNPLGAKYISGIESNVGFKTKWTQWKK